MSNVVLRIFNMLSSTVTGKVDTEKGVAYVVVVQEGAGCVINKEYEREEDERSGGRREGGSWRSTWTFRNPLVCVTSNIRRYGFRVEGWVQNEVGLGFRMTHVPAMVDILGAPCGEGEAAGLLAACGAGTAAASAPAIATPKLAPVSHSPLVTHPDFTRLPQPPASSPHTPLAPPPTPPAPSLLQPLPLTLTPHSTLPAPSTNTTFPLPPIHSLPPSPQQLQPLTLTLTPTTPQPLAPSPNTPAPHFTNPSPITQHPLPPSLQQLRPQTSTTMTTTTPPPPLPSRPQLPAPSPGPPPPHPSSQQLRPLTSTPTTTTPPPLTPATSGFHAHWCCPAPRCPHWTGGGGRG